MKLLEKHEINYNQDYMGFTAFIIACFNGMTELAIKLLEKPDLNYNICCGGYTAFILIIIK